MEIIFEFVLELVGQLIFEVIIDSGFRGFAKVVSHRVTRVLLGGLLALGGGLAAGYWWGSRLTEAGREAQPKSLWVSIALGLLFAALAVRAIGHSPARASAPAPAHPHRLSFALTPWQWSVARLLSFALMNAALATGIAIGFTPNVAA